MFNRMKAVVTFAAGAVAGLMLAACLTVQGSRPGVFGGEALILPLMALLLYVGYEAGRLSTLAQAEQRRRKRRAGPPYRVEHGSVGQSYPRAFARITAPHTPAEVAAAMRRRGVFIGTDKTAHAVYLSPLNLTDEECETVCRALQETAAELAGER